MSPIGWAVRPFQRYFQFSGRAPRAEYWWFYLATTVVGFAADSIDRVTEPMVGIYGPFSLASVLLLLSPGIAVEVRRFHDIGRTGWWALLSLPSYSFIIFGLLVADEAQFDAAIENASVSLLGSLGLAVVAGAIVLLIFMITEGDKGPNDHGPDPYGHDDLAEVFA